MWIISFDWNLFALKQGFCTQLIFSHTHTHSIVRSGIKIHFHWMQQLKPQCINDSTKCVINIICSLFAVIFLICFCCTPWAVHNSLFSNVLICFINFNLFLFLFCKNQVYNWKIKFKQHFCARKIQWDFKGIKLPLRC